MSTTGLRERKKAATKAALSHAALSLMLEQGLDAVRGDAIAAAVGVAPRTFRNYFSNKEEAILYASETVQSRYLETFMSRDPSESVLDSLEAAAIAVVEAAGYREHLVAAIRLIAHNPALVAHRATSRDAASATLVHRVADRTGTDPDDDLYPRLVCRAAEAVMHSVVEMYATRSIPSAELVDRVRQGFDQLRRGLYRAAQSSRLGKVASRPPRGRAHRSRRRARRSRRGGMIHGRSRARYQIISADGHTIEPPHMWETYLPAKFHDRMPRLVKDPKGGDAWELMPGAPPMPLGLVTSAGPWGKRYEELEWYGSTYDNIRAGAFDGKARLEDQDIDGCRAEVLYPSQRTMGTFMAQPDDDYHLAGIEAYNQWMHDEFMAADPAAA